MDNPEYIPVKPNINNYIKPTPRQKTVDNNSTSIFANSKDMDIQEFINKKKIDARTLDGPITKEEIASKASNNLPNNSTKSDEGSSWIIIILAIIVIVLILIIIYYKYHKNE